MTALAVAAEKAGLTTSTFAYFDLMENLEGVENVELRAGVLAYMAWAIDSLCIMSTRTLFRETYRGYLQSERAPTIDAYNTFIGLMNEAAANGDHLRDVGLEDTTAYTTLITLLNMRKHWHDIAGKAATGPYEPKSLSMMIIEEKLQKVDTLSAEKLAVAAKFLTRKQPARYEAVLKEMIDRENLLMAGLFNNRVATNAIIVSVLNHMMGKSTIYYDGESPAFDSLHQDVRKRLVMSALRAFDTVVSRMATTRRITTMQYQEAMMEAEDCKTVLEKVLQSPSYTNPAQGNDD